MNISYRHPTNHGIATLDLRKESVVVRRDSRKTTFEFVRTSTGFRLISGTHVYDLSLDCKKEGSICLFINGVPVSLTWLDLSVKNTNACDTSQEWVKSMMPGRVVRVHVQPGDRVTENQPLLVLEAMKMENELRSPRSGTIEQVLVKSGASVESGVPLVKLL